MKKTRKILSFIFYLALLLSAVVVTSMGYEQVMAVRSEVPDNLTTWLPDKQIKELMRFHGADVMKVTQDEVFIARDSKWVLVMKRDRG